MTAPSRLSNCDNERFGRAVKGVSPAVSAEINVTASFTDFITYSGGVEAANGGAWLDVGNAPGVWVTVAWTHKTTPDLFTLLPCFSNMIPTTDPTEYAPAPSIVQSDITAGVATAYPQSVVLSKTNWTTTTSPGSTSNIKYATVYVLCATRLVKFMGKADSATGTPTAHINVSVGPQD